jgi:hypothetical protein
MRYRDQNGQDWADIIDFLTMHPEAPAEGGSAPGGNRRKVERLVTPSVHAQTDECIVPKPKGAQESNV